MPGSRRILGIVALFIVVAGRPVQAKTPLSREGAAELMNGFWSLVSDVSARVGLQSRRPATPHPRPQAIPQGGPSVDLSDLSRPTVVEDRLRTVLRPGGELRLTIPGGTARRGDYSVGSEASLNDTCSLWMETPTCTARCEAIW